ncbi:hypothetical protein WJX81_000986 [Elliptochloris bilobata]|uniref:Fe2OG dioxygenase domain-containing protein n=1 Tax=Elliptochloris bilobata TaxID=381761 RepID=A0AAW1QN08_9CHLO
MQVLLRTAQARLALHTRSFTSLPVIDVSALLEPEQAPDARVAVAEQLHRACLETGFFYVRNHGIPESDCENVLQQARQWFALPESVKQEIALTPHSHFRGFQRLGDNVTRYEGGFARDWHEAIDLYREDSAEACEARGDPPSPLHGPNQWPRQLPEFDASLRRHVRSCLHLGQALMRGIALGLGLEERAFEAADTGGTTRETSYWTARVIHYPPLPQAAAAELPERAVPRGNGAAAAARGAEVERSVQLSCGEHTDYGLLTLVHQQPGVSALQVKNAAGQWVAADPVPGTLVCNIGDMLRVWTHGMYQPTAHRVINADPARSRISLPFFYEPAFEAVVAPLPELRHLAGSGSRTLDLAPAPEKKKMLSSFALARCTNISQGRTRAGHRYLNIRRRSHRWGQLGSQCFNKRSSGRPCGHDVRGDAVRPGQLDIRSLIRQFEPMRLAAAPAGSTRRPVDWVSLPRDIMRLVAARLPPHDVQSALLACREWHDGFASGLTAMKPRVLMVERLAHRFPAVQSLDLSACRRVGDGALAALGGTLALAGLRSLSLAGCEDVSDAGIAAVARLRALTHLDLRNCCKVTDASLLALAELPCLLSLDLSGCVAATERGIGALAARLRLSTLRLGGTSRVATVQDGALRALAPMVSLTCLDMSGCTEVTDAGLGAIGALTRLHELCLWNCMRVSEAGLGVLRNLPHLEDLSLRGCQHLTDAAAPAVARLRALTRLDLRCCERFTGDQLRALSALTGLRELNLKGCYKVADAGLAGVGVLTALTALCLHECWQITAQGLLALSGLSRLRDLNLQACRNIVTAPGQGLPGLAGLTALTALNLRGCDGLADGALDPLTPLTRLQALDLSGCQKLTGAGLLPVGALAALTALKLQHCRGLQRCADLAPLASLTALSALSLCGCTELQGRGISSLAPLTALRALSLEHCRRVTFAPDGLLVLTGLAGVAALNLQGCNALTDAGLAALGDMTSLTSVNLQDCRQVTGEGFAGWCHMPYLAALSLQNANAVTDAGCAAIARIVPLRTLNLKNCPAMTDKGLAALAPLKRLSHLRLQGNQLPGRLSLSQAVTDAGLGHCAELRALRHLELPSCWRLTDAGLKQLTSLTGLSHLDLSYCWQVTDEGVEVLASMASMAVLNLTGCHSITPRGRALVSGLLESPLSP